MKKIYVDTALEVNGECGIISTFEVKKNKKTEEHKMKVVIITLSETKRNILVSRNKLTLKMEKMNLSLSV